MAILPLQLARVSNSLKTGLAQRSLTQTQSELLRVQNELSTGKRLTSPSDDPGDAAIAQQLHKLIEQRETYADNLRHAGNQLSQVDSSLGTLTDLVRQAQTVASANVGSDVTADQRAAAATVISSIYNQALSLGNTQFDGLYLFGGDTGTQPFVEGASGVAYTGSSRVLQNRVEANTSLAFMANGDEIFNALNAKLSGANITPTLSPATRLSDISGTTGAGIRLSSIQLSNGVTTATVDLSTADTIGDVIGKINAAAVGGITASFGTDGNLVLTGDPTDDISVNESGGTTATDLGILTATSSGPGNPITGYNLAPRVNNLTPLAQLKNGAGIETSGLIITVAGKSTTIDLSGAQTVEDLLNKINGANIGASAQINAAGTGIDIINQVQGATLSVGENGGTTAADLGLRSFSPATLLSSLNNGQGVRTAAGADLQITARDGSTFSVDLNGLSTVQDVLDAINTASGGSVTATFLSAGNGIVLTDNTGQAGTLSARSINFSQAAQDLGLNVATTTNTLTGADVGGVTSSGLISNIARLRDALLHNDQNAITLSAEALQKDLDRVQRIHGQVGAQVKDIESRQDRLDDQKTATAALLSNIEEVDYNDAITRFTTLQTALQANLQTTGRLLNLSLLDFLQ